MKIEVSEAVPVPRMPLPLAYNRPGHRRVADVSGAIWAVVTLAGTVALVAAAAIQLAG